MSPEYTSYGRRVQLVTVPNLNPMTSSYMSEIVIGSTIIAILGAAAYMVFQHDMPGQQMASAIHAKAWGKQWPQSEDTIYKDEISDETSSVGNHDEVYFLADKLVISSQFNYRFFKEIRHLKTALGANAGKEVDDILVIHDEYKTLCQVLEHDFKDKHSVVVTGHLGIGSYESWFSSLKSNADFSPILRQEHLPPLPSFTLS